MSEQHWQFNAPTFTDFANPDFGEIKEDDGYFGVRESFIRPNLDQSMHPFSDTMGRLSEEPSAPAPAPAPAVLDNITNVSGGSKLVAPSPIKRPTTPVATSSSSAASNALKLAEKLKRPMSAGRRKSSSSQDSENMPRYMQGTKASISPRNSLSGQSGSKPNTPKSASSVTVPVPFNFSPRKSKPVLSSAEIEEMEIKKRADEKKNLLRKNAENYKRSLIASPPPKMMRSTKDCTIPEPFQFASAAPRQRETTTGPIRATIHSSMQVIAKAAPVPAAEGTTGQCGSSVVAHTTKPVEVKLHSASRTRQRELSTEERELEYIKNHPKFKALPVNEKILHSSGDLGVPRVVKKEVTQAVSPKFHTAERAKSEGKGVQSNDVPIPAPVVVKPAAVTPFKLESEVRGELKKKQMEEKLAREEEALRKQREFVAKPLPHSFHEPVVITPVKVAPVTPEPLMLNSDKRAMERKEFEERKKQKGMEEAKSLAEQDEAVKRQAELEIKEHRKSIEFKPLPKSQTILQAASATKQE